MRRVDFFIYEDSFDYLKSRSGTLSEHIRFAIAEYIHRLRREETKLARTASASKSVELEVEENG